MNILRKSVIAIASLLIGSGVANAQYYQMANQLPQMLEPALVGGFNYRGFVDASFTGGVDGSGCNFLEVSTTHGFKYGSWFFMGVGAGVNVMFAGYGDGDRDFYNSDLRYSRNNFNSAYDRKDTGVIVPLYTDFRFNFGNQANVSAFVDLRIGASFLIGKDYINTDKGVLDNNEGLYFRPTLGVRIPVDGRNSAHAFNLGLSYMLISNNLWDWNRNYDSISLSSLGVSVGYEW